jgi:hypothetical protein
MQKGLLVLLFLAFSVGSWAQNGSQNMISETEVVNFIDKFPKIKADLAAENSKLKSKSANDLVAALANNKDLLGVVLQKHGFTYESYVDQSTRITYAYQSLIEGERLARARADYEASVAKVKENNQITDAQKMEVLSQLDEIGASLKASYDQTTNSDLAIISKYRNQIKKIIK